MIETTIKERPILFSGKMVNAILEVRKTQTRRVMKPQPERIPSRTSPLPRPAAGLIARAGHRPGSSLRGSLSPPGAAIAPSFCPYGKPGDRLWVRETWALVHEWKDPETGHVEEVTAWTDAMPSSRPRRWSVWYAADGDDISQHKDDRLVERWRPSIHMPRWASRITLEITGVKVERLQEISEADAEAEGCDGDCPVGYIPAYQAGKYSYHFAQLWDSINGKTHPWQSNPWLWCITFRRTEADR